MSAWAALAAAVSAIAVSGPAGPALAAASASPATAPMQPVIVVLRDQLPGVPADRSHARQRAGAARGGQDAVLGRLGGPVPGKLKHFTLGNAFSATVTVDQADALAADPAVASVTPDRPVKVSPGPAATSAARAGAPGPVAAPSPVAAAACSTNPARPLLEPEALGTIRARSDDPNAATAAALGIDGSGVKVGYIADGINPANPGFRRADGSSAIVDYKDFFGNGPNAPTGGAEAFGDASAIAAQGHTVYDVADFANPAVVSFPGGHCYIRIVGVAPGAGVVALKAGSELLPNSAILQAIDYAVTVADVDVLNESFGANLYPDSGARNTIQLFNDQAVQAGVTVTASTGDAGITSTIGSPSTDPQVISTGASTDARLYEQTGYALATRFGNGRWLDDNVSALSSAGITQNGRTIDLSAPGEADWALCDDSGRFSSCTSFRGTAARIQSFGGTSQSAPMTAGVAALVIQAYRGAHRGASPAPALVKQLLTSTTRDLGLPGDEQGTGRIDARAAVEAALTYPGAGPAPAGVSANIALSTDQLTVTGVPGSTQTGTVSVRNVGSTPLTVVPATRSYATLSQQRQSATLSAASTQTTPYPTTAAPWVYQTLHFTVPTGADRLAATIRWTSGARTGQSGPVVRLSLFTPDGTYAANTRPQGAARPANFGLVDVRQPAPGTWTAVLYTPQTTGFTGTVALQTDTERALPVGSVRPALLSLPPGGSGQVTVTVPVLPVGGDAVDTLSLATSSGHQTAVPIIVRALVATGGGQGAFTGTITGGNARGGTPAQTFSYAFDVPAGKRDLDVAVTLGGDRRDLLEGVLVDPAGETPSIDTNQASDSSGRLELSMTNTVAAPQPGRWRYVVVVQNPVSGREFSQRFTGTVAFDRVSVSAPGLPTSPDTVVPAGTPVTVALTVTNPGPAPLVLQTDARTDPLRTVQLAPQFAGSSFALPLSVDNLAGVPAFLVPPDTSRVALSAASTVPAQVELNSPGGGIDLFGDLTSAQAGSTVSTATVQQKAPARVGQGYWFTYVQEIGPFGDGGAPTGSTTVTAVAKTRGFDRSVTTTTGDPYLRAVDPTAGAGPALVLAPGATGTIRVAITPAAAGTTVSGVLHLVTPPRGTAAFNTTGDIVATLPYAYTTR